MSKKVVFVFSLILILVGVALVHADPLKIQIRDGGKSIRTTIPWQYRSPVVTDEDRTRGYVIVQRGWTLGGIAKAVYGSYDVTKLVQYNDIKDINHIDIGQKIWVRPKVVLTEDERMAMARIAVWKRMKKCFYYRTRVDDYPVTADRAWAQEPLHMVQLSTSRLDLKQYFREVIRRTEWVDILEQYKMMVEVTNTPEELLRLAGLVWQESSFLNVIGKHGEIGPGQILPSTGLEILKKNPDLVPHMDVSFLTVEDVKDMLESVSFNVRMAYIHLKGLDRNEIKSLRKYNGSGPATIIYAKKVQERIERLKKGWGKEIEKLYQEKLKELE